MSKEAGAAAFRKTWDKEAFEARAKARLEQELQLEEDREARVQAPQPIVQRAPLQRREVDLQLTKYVNTRQMVTLGQATNGEMSGVYYCKVCDCHLRDSANYLLHINGKKHNRMLGMSMRAERATLGEVREKLASYKADKESEQELTKEEKAALFLEEFNARVEAQKEAEAQEKYEKALRKKEKRQVGVASTADAADEEDEEEGSTGGGGAQKHEDEKEALAMAAAGFDFTGFGGSKKQN